MTTLDEVDLIELAYGDPERAITRAGARAAEAEAAGDVVGAARALRAVGLAQRGTNDLDGARRTLGRAIELAAGDAGAEAAAHATLAGVHVLGGRLDEAETECRIALDLGGDAAAVGYATAQLGLVRLRRGESGAALRQFEAAVTLASEAGDRMTEANVRTNRAILLAYSGRCDAATVDLERARAIYVVAGQRLAAAGVAQNLGFVRGRAGDHPAALRHLDTAEAEFAELGIPTAELSLDRSEVLLAAGLAHEAARIADRAATDLRSAGLSASYAEALVALARARLLAGDAAASREIAGRAVATFAEQDRSAWGSTARLIELECRWQLRTLDDGAVADGRALSVDLRDAGLLAESDRAMLRTAQIAGELGQPDVALECIDAVVGRRRPASMQERAVREHAFALRCRWRGDRVGSDRHLRKGVELLDSLQATLGSSELRAGVGRSRAELVTIGVARAVEENRPAMALRWLERGRSPEAVTRVARDAEVDGVLSQLRVASAERATWSVGNRPDPDLVLRHRQLEAEAIRYFRRRSGSAAATSPALSAGTLRESLGGRSLHEFFVVGDELLVVRISARRTVLERLGRFEEIRAEVVFLRSALRRLRQPRLTAASASAARSSGRRSARALADKLFGSSDDGGPCVLCPPADLLDTPWSALPNLAGREVWVTPSATRWARGRPGRRGPGTVTLIAGPRLDHAEPEVRSLAGLHADANLVVGSGATSEALKNALGTSSVLHVSAHGEFRSDSPVFSSIELEDGPLVLAELESEASAPPSVVLAMCDSGRVGVRPGEEAIGLASAFLALGSRHVVTSVLPVDDRSTVALMVDVHDAIATTGNPAAGLARGTSTLEELSDLDYATRTAFVCVGSP